MTEPKQETSPPPVPPVVTGVKENRGEKPRLPKMPDSIGRSGYKGDVEVYEPAAPGVSLVNAEAEGKEHKGPSEDKAKRSHRKKTADTEPLPEPEEEPAE